MQHPSLSINLRIIEDNTRKLVSLCCNKGVIPVGVSRLMEGAEPIARAMMLGGIQAIGDTQINNLQKLADLPIRKMLLRRPLLSEVEDVVHHADISVHSERETLEALSWAAVKANKCHEVIIAHDLDDQQQDGGDDSETENLAELVLTLPGLTFGGIGCRLACFSEVESMTDSDELQLQLEEPTGWSNSPASEKLSGAGVAGIVLMVPRNGTPRINQLRLGRSSILGIGLNDASVPDTPQSAMSLHAEIVEIKEKSSVYAYSVFSSRCNDELQFNDRGIRLRALCAIGKHSVDINLLAPTDKGVIIIGATSDYLILDITDADNRYQVGESLSFYLSYHGVLQCMASESVATQYHF
ncbi:alanine racemase [Photobacterium sp. SDRW27]|uniref:alanine racemase n=1 Tax=Photobacterium obscurum TaxID=2829490 RepID=UPI002243ED75|nr:alanine racemase [Photobacterium obscurum]MCW8331591.1 alanine racemase [Photobacterium obscurum]